MRNTINPFLFAAVLFISCNNASKESNTKQDSIKKANGDTNKTVADTVNAPQSLTEEKKDILPASKAKNKEVQSVKEWKTDDFIVKEKDRSSEALRRTIEYEREQWKAVTNPFVATYRGCDIGDYFHLNFEDRTGKNYDFGFGSNNYGDYMLFTPLNYMDNPEYLGKSFRIYWSWKVSTFPCCDGEYDMVEAWLPSITRLELLKTTRH